MPELAPGTSIIRRGRANSQERQLGHASHAILVHAGKLPVQISSVNFQQNLGDQHGGPQARTRGGKSFGWRCEKPLSACPSHPPLSLSSDGFYKTSEFGPSAPTAHVEDLGIN